MDTGFIRNSPYLAHPQKGNVSPQLDVIIHDAVDYSPLFRSGQFVVTLAPAVVGVIEVKKELDPTELSKALDNLRTVREMCMASALLRPRVFTCIFAFGASKSLNPKTKSYSDTYRKAFSRVGAGFDAAKDYLPDAIVVSGREVSCEWTRMRTGRSLW